MQDYICNLAKLSAKKHFTWVLVYSISTDWASSELRARATRQQAFTARVVVQ